jgi:hydrogenase expression/formation protein HypE
MAVREGLSFESAIKSDCAPLSGLVKSLLDAKINIHCLRDLTRGGLASALVEIAESSRLHINIDERAIPVMEDVQGACEILGFDPIYVANEGRFVAFVAEDDVEKALSILRSDPLGVDGVVIGRVTSGVAGMVTMKSKIGVNRIVDMLSGEQLPRIC